MDPQINPIPQVEDQEPPQTKTKLILLFVGGGGAFVLLIILVISSFFFSKKPQQSFSNTTITPPSKNNTSSSSVSPSQLTSQTYKLNETFDPTNTKTTATADLPYYTMKYPQDWPPVMNYTHKTDDSFLFSIFPGNISGDVGYFPRLDVGYTYASVSGSVEQRANNVLQDANTKTISTTFHGYQAIKLSGPLQLTLLDSNPSGFTISVYKTYYVFQKGDRIYLVDYAYPGLVRNEQYETFFQGILNTLTFK